MRFTKLRPFAFYLGSEKEWAYMQYFERRLILKKSLGAINDKKLFDLLESGVNTENLAALASRIETQTDDLKQMIDLLEKENYLETLTESEKPDTHGQMKPHQVMTARFLNGSAQRKAVEESVRHCPIIVWDDFQLEKQIHTTLKASGFENITVRSLSEDLNLSQNKNEIHLVIGSADSAWRISKANSAFLRAQKNWTFFILDYWGGMLGPWMGAPSAPCFDCITTRMKALGTMSQIFFPDPQRMKRLNPQQIIPSFVDRSLEILALEAYKRVSQVSRPANSEMILTFDFFNHLTETHFALMTPNCETCNPQAFKPDYQEFW